jgi:PAS domain S-box-containing protein
MIRPQDDRDLAQPAPSGAPPASITDGVFAVDEAGALTYVSPALEVVSGYQEAEILGRHFTEFVHPEDAGLSRRGFERALAGGTESLDYRVLTKAGKVRWVRFSGSPVKLATGRTGMRAVLKDITEERRVQEAVARREERFRNILETVSDIIVLIAPDATTQYVTPSVQRILGYRPDEVVGRNIFDFVCAGDRDRLRAVFAEHLLDAGGALTVEYCAEHKDGTARWLESISINRMHDPSVGAIVISSRDVTERRETAAALRESEEKYRELVESINDVIFAIDAHGIFTYMSPVIHVMTGYRPEDIVGRHFSEFIHPDDVAFVVRDFEATLSGHIEATEFRVIQSHGGARWFRTFSRPVTVDARIVGMRGVARDITERKRAEEDLRESELKFRTLAESTGAAIFIHRGSALQYVNPAAATLTGYSQEELLAMDFWDVLDPRFRAQAQERSAQRLQGIPVPARAVVKILRKDRCPRWVDFTAAVIDYGGHPAVLGTAIDITERRAAEREARERHAELAHVLRVKTMGEMAAMLAHELNQPLQAVVNFARGCKRHALSNVPAAELVEPLEQIAAQALRAGEIVRGVRRFVQKEQPKREPTNVNALVTDAAHLLEAEALREEVAMQVQMAPDIVAVEIDAVQIEQVILNLLRNGLEAMRPRSDGERTLVVATSMPNPREVEVMIRDTGDGFPPEVAAHLFTPFFTTKPHGLGMGLAISRSIIEAHGGRISATSTPGRGTTVRFALPVHAGGQA